MTSPDPTIITFEMIKSGPARRALGRELGLMGPSWHCQGRRYAEGGSGEVLIYHTVRRRFGPDGPEGLENAGDAHARVRARRRRRGSGEELYMRKVGISGPSGPSGPNSRILPCYPYIFLNGIYPLFKPN